jgi:Na+/proline symporter
LIIAGLFFAKPLWKMKLLTMGDFYRRVYGPRSELVATCVLIPSYFGWIGAQLLALGTLQETFFGIPLVWGMAISAAFIFTYTVIGGMWSVTMTDTLQLVVLLTGLVVLAWTIFSQLGEGAALVGVGTLFRDTNPELLTLLPEATLAASLAWTATLASGFFGNIPGQDLMQRVFSSKDAKTAKWACLLAGAAYLLFGLLPVGMGLASRILVPESDDGAILAILAQQFLTPTLTAVFVVSLVSIIVSTATSAVLAPATLLGHNLMARLRPFQQRKLLVERIAVGIMVAGGFAMAFTGESILELLESAVAIVLVGLFVPLVMGLYGRPRSELPALLSIALGSLVWLARELLEGFFLPISDSALAAGIAYPDFVSSEHSSEHSSEMPDVIGSLLYGFALLPSAISGVAASAVGYWLGQVVGRGKKK